VQMRASAFCDRKIEMLPKNGQKGHFLTQNKSKLTIN